MFFFLLFCSGALEAGKHREGLCTHRFGKDIDRKRLERVDDVLTNAVARESLPSAVCYVAYRGRPVYYKAFGFADREDWIPLKKNAIFRIASQTRLITTVALMILYEEGLFHLDDPVKKFLPEFSNPQVYVSGSIKDKNLVTRPAKGDITIRQLLSNTSGIGYDRYDQDVDAIHYSEPVCTREVVERIARLPLKNDPGKGFTYGFGMDVAGRIAEVASGIRLDSLIRKKVLVPLEMDDSYFFLPKNKADRLVPLYQKPERSLPVTIAVDSVERFYPLARNQVYIGGGGGMCGSIKDFAHLCQMLLDGGRYRGNQILSPKTVKLMGSDQLFRIQSNHVYGLSLEIATGEDFVREMFTPGSLRGGGYYGTEFMIDPENDLVVLLYTNKYLWYDESDVWGDVQRAVYMSLK